MPLIDATYFYGEINVPNIDTPGAVLENLEDLIKKYEAKFLKTLLGKSVYELFIAEMAKPDDEQEQIWKDLKSILVDEEIKLSPIANYVYRFYQYNQFTVSTGSGEKQAKNENSTRASVVPKVVRAWNEMSDWMMDNRGWFIEFYSDNEFEGYYFSVLFHSSWEHEFSKINRFGL